MPINPGKKENEEDFIGRCMSEETQTYDTPQAYAICKSKWDKEHMSKFSSPYDRTNSKFNSIRIKRNLINKFETQPTIDSSYAGEPSSGSVDLVEGCPSATQDIAINLEGRQKAIDIAHYGPLNPNDPNEEYWKAKADMFGGAIEDAKKALCGNCAFFVQTQKMLDCIASAIGGEDAWSTIDAGDLGYCEAFDFKCASKRTCDAWVVGGPITD